MAYFNIAGLGAVTAGAPAAQMQKTLAPGVKASEPSIAASLIEATRDIAVAAAPAARDVALARYRRRAPGGEGTFFDVPAAGEEPRSSGMGWVLPVIVIGGIILYAMSKGGK